MPAASMDACLTTARIRIPNTLISENSGSGQKPELVIGNTFGPDSEIQISKIRRGHFCPAVQNVILDSLSKLKDLPVAGVLGMIFLVGLNSPAQTPYNFLEEDYIGASLNRVEKLWEESFSGAPDNRNVDLADGFLMAAPDPCEIGLRNSLMNKTNAGDYIDRYWYNFVDRLQYYYLDSGQYNMLGGFSYVLGHPCYPKMFEREIDQAVGFGGRVYVFWFGISSYMSIESGYAQSFYSLGDHQSALFKPWIGGAVKDPAFGLRITQTAGDYIDRWQYRYKDLGQYLYLDDMQYDLLGGLAYMYGRFGFGSPHADYNYYISGYGYSGLTRGQYTVPEPSSVTFIALGLLAFIRSKRRPD